jgi:toxin ParE1/3/4
VTCYKLAPAAEWDLEQIWFLGLERFGLGQADHYYYALMCHFNDLAENPLSYPAVDHIRKDYRRSAFGAHSVFYRISNDQIVIMRIIGQQDYSG